MKKFKTNEKVLTGEIDHLRQQLDKMESIPDKQKDINALTAQIKEVSVAAKLIVKLVYSSFLQINENHEDFKRSQEKVILDLESTLKDNELTIEGLSNEIDNLNE